jgi:hypothetical protein
MAGAMRVILEIGKAPRRVHRLAGPDLAEAFDPPDRFSPSFVHGPSRTRPSDGVDVCR